MMNETNQEKSGELVAQIAANINKCSFQEGRAWSSMLSEQPSDPTERSMDAVIAHDIHLAHFQW
jgi:hypothetical protein